MVSTRKKAVSWMLILTVFSMPVLSAASSNSHSGTAHDKSPDQSVKKHGSHCATKSTDTDILRYQHDQVLSLDNTVVAIFSEDRTSSLAMKRDCSCTDNCKHNCHGDHVMVALLDFDHDFSMILPDSEVKILPKIHSDNFPPIEIPPPVI